jgi:hypothetical protein
VRQIGYSIFTVLFVGLGDPCVAIVSASGGLSCHASVVLGANSLFTYFLFVLVLRVAGTESARHPLLIKLELAYTSIPTLSKCGQRSKIDPVIIHNFKVVMPLFPFR